MLRRLAFLPLQPPIAVFAATAWRGFTPLAELRRFRISPALPPEPFRFPPASCRHDCRFITIFAAAILPSFLPPAADYADFLILQLSFSPQLITPPPLLSGY